jgi:hypothetical protein
MYLIGNARVMTQPEHGIWPGIMKELKRDGRIGHGFLIVCKDNPNERKVACCPEEFEEVANGIEKEMEGLKLSQKEMSGLGDEECHSILDEREW